MGAALRFRATGRRLAGTVAVIVGLTAFDLWFGLRFDTRPRAFLASDLGLAISFAVPGALLWRLRPRSRTGLLMLLLGLVILVETPYGYGLPAGAPGIEIVLLVGEPLYWLQFALAGQLLVTYPSGRLTGRRERRLVRAAYALVALGSTSRLAAHWAGLEGAAFERVRSVFMVLWIGLSVVTAATLLRRAVQARPRPRREYRFAIITAAMAIGTFVAGFSILIYLGEVGDERAVGAVYAGMAWAIVIALPFTFFVGLLGQRLAFAAVGGNMSRLAEAGVTHVEAVLGEVLRDPGVKVGFPEAGGLRDVLGRPLHLPVDGSVAVTPVGRPPVAVLIHDPALAQDGELLAAVTGAARLTLDNARLYALLQAQLDEVFRSRQRLAATADHERHRLERELNDGALPRLAGIESRLHDIQDRLSDPADRAMVVELRRELHGAVADVRDLGQGLRPAVLTEHGLTAALTHLGRRVRIPVALDLRLPGARLRPVVEATAYYLVSEALQNVVKHAGGSGATVRAFCAGDGLVVEVVDAGPGGAAGGSGSGLLGLQDRVSAVGGRFSIDSTDDGTRIHAEIPCLRSDDHRNP